MIGNFGLSYEQSRVQMAMWSMMASPLLIATDLRTITADMKSLIQNKYLIAINQDPLGIQGKMIGTVRSLFICEPLIIIIIVHECVAPKGISGKREMI